MSSEGIGRGIDKYRKNPDEKIGGEYSPRLMDVEVTPVRTDSLLYEKWTPEQKLQFQKCVIPPVGKGVKPGINQKMVDALPAGHPAREGYISLDVRCAWIDIEFTDIPRKSGDN